MSQNSPPASDVPAATVTQDMDGNSKEFNQASGQEGMNYSMDVTIALEELGDLDTEGSEAHERPLLLPAIRWAHESGYNGPVLPLTWAERTNSASEGTENPVEVVGKELGTALLPEELVINLPEWPSLTNILYARIHLTSQLSSMDDRVQVAAEQRLRQFVSWAGHISLGALILRMPETLEAVPIFARSIAAILPVLFSTHLWIDVEEETSGWEKWECLSSLVERSSRIHVALRIRQNHAQATSNAPSLGQWKAEPISALILPDTTFVPNSKGYPTLYRPHQSFLRSMIPLFPAAALIVACTGSNSRENPELYLQYLRHITATLPTPSVVDTFASGYQDYLQAPLQPLMDNLDSGTYTVFERDPVKYVQYEEAIFQALQDHHTTPQCNPPVIMVVGAGGRGPLVDCALRASQRAEIPIRVFAVEKNPNALVTLRVKKAEHWGDQVEIIHEDMRRWKAPELADILVSELLGSFGDNELSPECLDGAQAFLKENGISIPCNSTAHLALLSSSKLHAEASAYGERSKMETPYVVMFRKVHEATAPQAVWTFEHPLRPGKGDNLEEVRPDNKHNCRYAQREFTPGFPMRLDGLAGYFDSCLYKDVYLSIHPETFSDGMFSWFPIYFPIHTPLLIPEGGKVCVRMWRRTAQAHVWYEWSVDIHSREGQYLYRTPIHNLSGRSYKIGM